MAKIALWPGAIPNYRRGRIAACGRPITLVTRSGKTKPSTLRCKDQYCEQCGPRAATRAFACILSAIEAVDGGEVYAVTLTRRVLAPRRRRQDDWLEQHKGELDASIAEEEELSAQIARDTAHWAYVTSTLRAADYYHRRHRDTGRAAYQRKASRRDPRPRPVNFGSCVDPEPVDSEYGARGWIGATGQTSYIWAREITRGRSGMVWHVHRHVICADLVTAQRIVAAHAAYRCEIQGSTPYVASIQRWDSERAAGYVAGYISGQSGKSGGWASVARSLSHGEQLAWVSATKGLRKYDASGIFRPLGIGKKLDQDDAPIAVVDAGGAYEIALYYQKFAGTPTTAELDACACIEQTAQTTTSGGEPLGVDSAVIAAILAMHGLESVKSWSVTGRGNYIERGG